MATASVLQLHRAAGRGRQPASVERIRDLEDELTARKAEAVALVIGLLPLVAFVTSAAREVGPREYQAAVSIAARLRRYQAQNEEPEPDATAVAA